MALISGFFPGHDYSRLFCSYSGLAGPICGLIFSHFNIFLTTYWTLKPVDQELKPVGTAGFKGLRKTLNIS